MPSLEKKPFKREIELDFVRGLAILMVIDFHSPKSILFKPFTWLGWRHFGWAGVDIFFVLSGFLVGGLLIKEWKVRGRIDGKRFLIRRCFKIWPQYYVFLLLIIATGHRSIKDLWGNIFNIQNYVGGVAHTWSLAVEEHAYLLLLLVLTVAARQQTRMRNLFLFITATIVFVSVLCLVLSARGFNTFPTTHTRIDGILYGVLLAILYHYDPKTFHKVQEKTWLWVGVVLSVLAFFWFVKMNSFWAAPLSWIFANWLGIALLMLLYKHQQGRVRPALYRFIAWIGLYSYGIYLWHVSVISYVESFSRHLPSILRSTWETAGPYVFGILLGIFFTKLVEFPALRLRDRLFPTRVDSAVGIPAEVEERALHLP